MTQLLGPRWSRSRTRIEIDLTYLCNMACNDCNRSVTQAPSSESITLARIERFVAESIASGARWENIRLLGGEPTLHPQFAEIVDVLRAYRDAHLPRAVIEVISNGHGARVTRALAALPDDVKVVNTMKRGNQQAVHQTFNRAPCDQPEHRDSDYANGCFLAQYAGTGLTPSGYYHCSVAGGIDRIFGLDLGQDTLPEAGDAMHDEMRALCRFCGHFTAQTAPVEGEERVSRTWREGYAAWFARKGLSGRAAE